jgi:hypothetical protein
LKTFCLSLALLFTVTNADAQRLPSAPQQQLIVHDVLGLTHLNIVCALLRCNVVRGLGDPAKQAFLVTPQNLLGLNDVLSSLSNVLGIVGIELDQVLNLDAPPLSVIPDALTDALPVNYYGTIAWNGYLNQPANQIVRTAETQTHYQVSGSGIVAVIDTGVDPTHPALAPILLPGYDFTRNVTGADETGDLDHSTAAVLDGGGGTPVFVTPSLATLLTALGASSLSNPQFAAFGHGTMTAGIVHLVAPTANILPLKAFSASGTGNLSDTVRAIYYAVAHGSKVISMSFNYTTASPELTAAINYAQNSGVIMVASAGNNGQKIMEYPASLSGVIGVGSTSNSDIQSSFSNYGAQVVWVAAPGENIVSTYPFGNYATSSGTSFSAPFVAGTSALLVGVNSRITPAAAANAIAQAKALTTNLNHGRLDTYQAIQSVAP